MPSSTGQGEVDESTPLLSQTHVDRVAQEDDLDFDARFKKWKAAVAKKFRRTHTKDRKPVLLVSLFDQVDGARHIFEAHSNQMSRCDPNEATSMTAQEFRFQVDCVKKAIAQGIYPKMIATGSSGSYFVRIPSDTADTDSSTVPHNLLAPTTSTTTVAVFKPKDEEPYGNLNPKRQFLRKYFWWAMGRPCLIPNFSYLSEVGASYLDSRLDLGMVPRTELVELSSPTFHYAFSDRKAYEAEGVPLPAKIGSYQTFLNGYINASDFLRRHPWPSRSRSEALMMRDFEDERRAHKVSRKKQKAHIRNCGIAVKRLLLCRPSWSDLHQDDRDSLPQQNADLLPSHPATHTSDGTPDGFYWTPKRMEQFRLQLEKLVILDFLMRNTDRGLDNFMVKHDALLDEIKIGAIDNSLSFPIKHPNEIRQYPFGWLFLPTDLIGLPFSASTRQRLLPVLNDPVWWQRTVHGLRKIFQQDPYFDEAKFEKQMSVMRGQGWNLVQCLANQEEGPLDLCAKEKKLIRQEIHEVTTDKLDGYDGVKLPIDAEAQIKVDILQGLERQRDTVRPNSPPPLKPLLNHSASSSHSHHPSSSAAFESRPIGIRASLSYRQALLLAAGAGASTDAMEYDPDWDPPPSADVGDAAQPRSLPEPSVLGDAYPQSRSSQKALLSEQTTETDGSDPRQRRPSRHSRIASAQEAGSYLRREPARLSVNDTARKADSILGRTGIEVLEDLDRERKQQRKIKLFRSSRSRSTTVSIPASSRGADGKGHIQNQYDEVGTGPDTDGGPGRIDLASSIMSDPGFRPDRASNEGRSRVRATRHPSSGGMSSSTHDLYGHEEVLSEEDEDVETNAESRSAVRRPRNLCRGASLADPGPSIRSVLESATSERNADKNQDPETTTKFTPHIPHPLAISSTEHSSGDTQRSSTKPGSSSNTTIRIIVEKMSSDTKQAWLKWI